MVQTIAFNEGLMNTTAPSIPVTPAQRSLQAWGLLILIALIWGSSFILIKRSLVGFSTTQVATGRIFFAFLFFLPYLLLRIKQFPTKHWLPLLASGLLGYQIPAFLFAIGGAHLNSSLSGALNALSPLFTLLVGVAVFGRSVKKGQLAGVLLGFAGSVFLVFFSATGSFSFNAYALLIVLATLCYGFNINIVSRYLTDLSALVSTASMFGLVGPIALLGLSMTDFPTRAVQPTASPALLTLATLGVLGSGFATMLFNRVVLLTSALFASTVTYLMPIVALLWGILDGETLYWPQVAGMVICLLGVYLMNRK